MKQGWLLIILVAVQARRMQGLISDIDTCVYLFHEALGLQASVNGLKARFDMMLQLGLGCYNNRRIKKIMETMNVTFDELSAVAFEQRSSKPRLQGMTSRQISSGLDLTYAPSTISSHKPTERELARLIPFQKLSLMLAFLPPYSRSASTVRL
ncbi:hypothetical protein Tco_0282213 [Tanacetum coccineum]